VFNNDKTHRKFFINQKNKKFNIKIIFSKQTYQLFDKIIKKLNKTMLSEFSRIENFLKIIIVDGTIYYIMPQEKGDKEKVEENTTASLADLKNKFGG